MTIKTKIHTTQHEVQTHENDVQNTSAGLQAQPCLIYREHHMRPVSCVESAMTCCSHNVFILFKVWHCHPIWLSSIATV